MQELKHQLQTVIKKEFGEDFQPQFTRPDEKFGDLATNAAMQLGKKLGKNPREVAILLAGKLRGLESIQKVEIADPGFINFFFSGDTFQKYVHDAMSPDYGKNDLYKGQTIVLEHTDPNPFKEFHIGHAYSNTVGVSVGKLLENARGKVHQVTYQGDVGLHIAMAIYGMKKMDEAGEGRPLSNIGGENRQAFIDLGRAYSEGVLEYKNDPNAKEEIDKINAHLYSRDHESVNRLYDKGRKWSLEAFEEIYEKLDAHFEKNYFESDTAKEGIEIVKKNSGKIFEESEGATIYDGEKVGLHKRVFITKQGLPTYEAKEVGLAYAKARDYPGANKFIVITANEIEDYFKVLVAAIEQIDPELASRIQHITHGVVRLPEGKMSSRTGDVVTLNSLESDIKKKIRELYGEGKDTPEVVFGSMKYEFLKHRLGQDIIYDITESVSLEGNSGPYLQYAYARARSIMNKSKRPEDIRVYNYQLNDSERSLVRKISEFPEVVEKTTSELRPHYICTYLYELTQSFNRFYEKNRVIGSEREIDRLTLLSAYIGTLEKGLGLLNIAAPEHV
ncbi:arginine--tRNA ligase [Candidatus Saccharibacteria bacterium RIFCSPHIGHO2_12_FULL_49_19]|nr:MAG: arginine--tRNA ligase [Candidatus Saccharibacteria bacterium RIFCSPHIGHO2_01_FULL_49_21]OGL36515.1 MAG: arginine--tRNA ligase [Candidatus Saccharibacteria bacterium RIFCSPHIGHO2_12_FULL_49_19]OGL38644.1 MAG: arginine--tRNA ligase [Candidatus Saccharibacteria bacterium RIFCSPLOWO2_01_FULL_49_22]